ncbi:DUF6180 family protein [Shinella zoogloeoides]|uniref:DUF6180 family protein n=1 Tax=Shinella zoogloeoides TaxID=352475 RepID=UPI00299F19AE|nr:DUF6180 family protein [Shinella zoogloeoides]WPE23667.1 hypothetical protein ShzoTeo12_48870 [Shinella zoogloeoides]
MMKMFCAMPVAATILAALPAAAADDPFMITYHVERTASDALSLDACTDLIEQQAQGAGYRVIVNRFEGQLGVISGGPAAGGSFISHCISVDDKTVSVIQGLDYKSTKGPVGDFADRVHRALLDAAGK